jgi:hypothetical protein
MDDPVYASADFLIFDELTLLDLTQANLHFFSEPLIVGNQIVNCLLDEFVGATAS